MPRHLPANEHTAHTHTRMLDILSSPIYHLTFASASNRLLSHPSDAPKADAKKPTTNDPDPMGLTSPKSNDRRSLVGELAAMNPRCALNKADARLPSPSQLAYDWPIAPSPSLALATLNTSPHSDSRTEDHGHQPDPIFHDADSTTLSHHSLPLSVG